MPRFPPLRLVQRLPAWRRHALARLRVRAGVAQPLTDRAPVTLDGTTLALVPTPARRKAQLDRLEGVRREMSRVYRAMESGACHSRDGSRLVYVLPQIAKVLELTEIERRLIAVENRTRG
jgi:hypothetical protein